MSDEFECPYCKEILLVDWSDGEPSSEQECEYCEKKFFLEIDYNPVYYPQKRDCWNGSPHEYRPDFMNESYWSKQGFNLYHCKICHEHKSEKVNI